MHAKMLLAVALGMVVACATAVRAQGPPGGMPFPPGGPGGAGGSLLNAPSVQEELKLTDTQKDQLKRVDAAMRQKGRQAFESAGENGFDPQAMRSAMLATQRERESAVAKILDKDQKARLAQIELQRDGMVAAARKDVAAKIKLTATQAKKVKAIVDDLHQSQARAMPRPPDGGGFPDGPPPGGGGPPPGGGGFPGGGGPGGPPPGGGFPNGGPPGGGAGGFPNGGPPGGGPPPGFDPAEFRAQFAKMREAHEAIHAAANKKVEDVLTKDQRIAFEALLGKPFDLKTIQPGPPPGMGPGPDGPPPGDGGRPRGVPKGRRNAGQ